VKAIGSYDSLEDLGRVRLSKTFFMRDFLHSEIANWYQIQNFPDHPDLAIEVGTKLCETLLEPLQEAFGRIAIRSGYRSPAVNALGCEKKHNCASNEANFGHHIWDYPDSSGHRGATACVVVPWFLDRFDPQVSWTSLAWWIHDHLPYDGMTFHAKLGAFNIRWSESPTKRIDSYVPGARGCLTRPGMDNHDGLHAELYAGLPDIRSGIHA
jgi:hypothetical protein